MAFTLVQAGSTLVPFNSDGGKGAALTLPTGISLSTTRVPRFARFGRYLILVNTPTRPISIDELGVVRPLTPETPSHAMVLSNENGGALSGTYLAKQTFILKDPLTGNLIGESDFGPLSNEVTITTDYLRADNIALALTDTITGIRIYRTATGPGTEYFKWVDLDGNTQTAYRDDLSDAGLSIVSAPSLGPAPDLTLIKAHKGRLWGVSRDDVDHLRYTESGTAYAWSALNTIAIPNVGDDAAGIIGIIPRRDALAVGRRTGISQINGTSRSNFGAVSVPGGEGASLVSQESVVVRRDVAYFLGLDGVYKWDGSGIHSITDGRVRSWFTTDTYFNRSMFFRAQAGLDPLGLKYRLMLCSPDSLTYDRWIEFDFTTEAWYGPHLTNAFVPSSFVTVAGSNGQFYLMMGSREGYLSQDQEARNDWGLVGIPFHATTIGHDMSEPDLVKHWGELTIHGKAQTAGTMDITPTVGPLDADPQDSFEYDMTEGRQKLYRMGTGEHFSMDLEHDTVNEEVMLYGYEVPVHTVGRR